MEDQYSSIITGKEQELTFLRSISWLLIGLCQRTCFQCTMFRDWCPALPFLCDAEDMTEIPRSPLCFFLAGSGADIDECAGMLATPASLISTSSRSVRGEENREASSKGDGTFSEENEEKVAVVGTDEEVTDRARGPCRSSGRGGSSELFSSEGSSIPRFRLLDDATGVCDEATAASVLDELPTPFSPLAKRMQMMTSALSKMK
jgi:hypothetical protein